MFIEIFFETAELARNFDMFDETEIQVVDDCRVVVEVDWHPSHLRGLTTEVMDMVGVVDCDSIALTPADRI
tara:strand:- start:153 stop:365 length:213 start_codon:yes stop_codon:yes gene_type:complete